MAERIVLLHGIFRTTRSMRGLETFLRAQGYEVLNLGYPSTRLPIERIVEHIHPAITAFTGDGPLHVVGYSMGGLVARAYIYRYAPAHLGRVVLLATPNHGSEVADALKDWWLYRRLYGPAGQQLVTHFPHKEALFGRVTYPLAVLAGDRSIDPFCARFLPRPHDSKVSVASTRLEGMMSHRILRTSHMFFPADPEIWRHTLAFLKAENP